MSEQPNNNETIHRQINEYLEKRRIRMADFVNLYGEEQVNQDREIVEKLKRQFDRLDDKETSGIARDFEGIVARGISDFDWFGTNAQLIHTCPYDDFVNGVDGVLHIQDMHRDTTIALGVDVTFRNDLEVKFKKIKAELKQKQMATIKYFKSTNFRGEKSNIPRIILGAAGDTVKSMVENWHNDAVLQRHWLQYQLLCMAIIQCKVFGSFCKKINFTEGYDSYNHELNKLEHILSSKKKANGDFHDYKDTDGFFKNLVGICADFDNL